MHTQESLSLVHRLESSHSPLSDSCWLVREFCPIVGILRRVVNRLGDLLSMSDTVASQFVRDDLPGFTAVTLEQTLEKALGRFSVPARLEKHVNNFTILIDRPPEVLLLSLNSNEDFIDEKCIAKTLVPTFQALRVLRPELVTPQTNRFTADRDAPFCQ